MSGLIDKITHRHGHKNVATTGTTAPIIAAPQSGPILTSQTSTVNTGYVQQPGLTKTNLNTSGGVMNTSGTILNSATTLNTTTPLATSSSSTTIQQPIQHATTHVSAPIIQETVRNDRVVEVQPILHREVDQNIVHHIEKHYQEPAPAQGGVVERQALVQQQVHTNVVNEIQPIIHRERVVPVVERSEQHLTQHIVQPTIHTHEVVYERGTYQTQNLGIQQQGLQQGFQQQNLYSGLNFPYTGARSHSTYGYPTFSRDQKALRFEQKAAEWERRGNMAKAQKNRNKALQYRQMGQPGYVRPQRPQNYYSDRANLFDQKALRYQQLGMNPQAQRYQGRSQRLRSKHNLGPYQQGQTFGLQQQGLPMQQGLGQNIGLQQQGLPIQQGLGQNLGLQQQGLGQNLGLQQGLGQNLGLQQGGLQQGGLSRGLNSYQGLNFPYTGATNHSTYGYPKLNRDQKASRFEQKAAEWERRGDMTKAQKNRNKALQYRQMGQPGYVRPQRPQNYYSDRANLFNQKAQNFQQLGMQPQSQRYQGRADRLRAKHNLGAYQQNNLGQNNLGQQQGQNLSWTLQGLPQDKLQQQQALNNQQYSAAR